mmetsp:Transcript_501/g.620  ORF Transcript_501/g.620 Transcript_501/m.620 type:complete len:440 (+) Transcript_501:206-1525(+)
MSSDSSSETTPEPLEKKDQKLSRKKIKWLHLILIAVPIFVCLSLFRSHENLKKSFTSQFQSSLFKSSLNEAVLITYNDSLQRLPSGKKCFLWEEDTDHWWTHHPMWQLFSENETHTCFRYVHARSRDFLFDIYKNQFMSDCKNIMTRYMIDSGWAADWGAGIVHPIQEALRTNRTLAIRTYAGFWHYAALKPNGTNPTCPAKDLTCYFLPLTNCKPSENRSDVITNYFPVPYEYVQRMPIVYKYVMRPKKWLRRKVNHMVEDMRKKLDTPCSVLHVRRADVILHSENSRKYYPISDYMNKLPENRNNTIFLLTDDANAIEEAEEFFPDSKWVYFNRTRHKGASGGWENQIPSKSPKEEVITILATMKLVATCDTIVYGESGFGSMLAESMEQEGNSEIRKIRVDEGVADLVSAKNRDSDKKLDALLNVRRNKTSNITKI